MEVFVEEETKKEVEDLGKMMLLERIALLDRPEWTPPVCVKCSKSDPGHTELECPDEYCGWCKLSGSFGFRARHKCMAGYEQEEVIHDGWGAADEYTDQNRWD